MSELPPDERKLRASLASHTSWGNTVDRTARTQPGRQGLDEKFLREADGDPVRAKSLRKAHFARMALASKTARRKKKEKQALDTGFEPVQPD